MLQSSVQRFHNIPSCCDSFDVGLKYQSIPSDEDSSVAHDNSPIYMVQLFIYNQTSFLFQFSGHTGI